MRFSVFCLLILSFISGALFAQLEEGIAVIPGDTGFAARYVIHDEHLIMAPHHYEGRLQESRMAHLFFGKDDFHINPDLPMNRIPVVKQHLDLLYQPLRIGWETDTVLITGYASPEGDSLYNRILAEKRAKAGAQYVREAIRPAGTKKQSYTILTETGGEDWEGLAKTLRASDLPGKDKILDIIDNQYDKDIKLQDLLKESQVSDDLRETFLPLLRRISIRIHYREPLKTDEEILELALAQPHDLLFSQLMYAATLTDAAEEQLRIYQNACQQFPDEWKAPNNAACIYLGMDQPEKAMVYLNQASTLFPKNGIILNNIAAASLMLNRPDKAIYYLESAEKEGADISYNLGIYYLLTEMYDQAYLMLEKYPCNANAGLAALLSNRLQKAVEQFTCSPETARNHYLAAICEARSGNETALKDHLEKAIQLDTSLINTIRNDFEFSSYKNREWFKEFRYP